MKLKGKYFKKIHEALSDAFDPASLAFMARTNLDLKLDNIVGKNANMKEMVTDLIRWAEDRDRVEELIAGARKANSTNKKLETVEEQLLSSGKDAYVLSDDIATTTEATTTDIDTDTYIDTKTGLEMIRIPAGEFIYGEDNLLEYLPEFWIAKTPVTNALYLRFVRETGYDPPKHWEGKSPKVEIADHPVFFVSWHDAKASADWAGMDLPTEEEWEKAARGTDGRLYPWGLEWHDGYCNMIKEGIGATTPVGQYSPQGDSPYGCVDMAGNVMEWTISWYDKRKKYPVVRGCYWEGDRNDAHVSRRSWDHPKNHAATGFRLVRRHPPE